MDGGRRGLALVRGALLGDDRKCVGIVPQLRLRFSVATPSFLEVPQPGLPASSRDAPSHVPGLIAGCLSRQSTCPHLWASVCLVPSAPDPAPPLIGLHYSFRIELKYCL